tara:strand:+ start:792948 stop:794117 length:1170 start_codon:yes stop_codon:yes gene_type:complete
LNLAILHPEVQDFINKNLNNNISKLLFKGSPFDGITIQELAEQLEAKKKCQSKLPSWFKVQFIYYPNKLNIEQTSSEITANYKTTITAGNTLIDLTGGFGVDAYYFSKQFKEVTHCEINEELSAIVKHNFQQLNAPIKTVAGNGFDYLTSQKRDYDWIYIDPSRRNDIKGKVFLLKDCFPNVPENLDILFEFTNKLLIKVSPILDITSAINELKFVKEIHVVAVNNEVKELLFYLEQNFEDTIVIKTINNTSKQPQLFEAHYKNQVAATYSLPLTYLYEPNAAILKAGLFNDITRLKVKKLHINSHLYTAETLLDFPGRRFMIKDCIPYQKKQLTKLISAKKANITTRNFPETVTQIRKKIGFKEGGDVYLFFTTNLEQKHIVLVCEKV